MKISAGCLLWRKTSAGIEVLIVHPSGNYNKDAPWSIPKGQPDPGETLESAARRETLEETGVDCRVPLTPIGHVIYKSGKYVHAFVGNMVECTPSCTSWEIDRAEFVLIETARQRLHKAQQIFLDRMLEVIQ